MNLIKAITNDYPPCVECKHCIRDRYVDNCYSPKIKVPLVRDCVTGRIKEVHVERNCRIIRNNTVDRIVTCQFVPKEEEKE